MVEGNARIDKKGEAREADSRAREFRRRKADDTQADNHEKRVALVHAQMARVQAEEKLADINRGEGADGDQQNQEGYGFRGEFV